MTCLHPISVDGGSMACGHCMACRITIAREWTVRNLHELSYWDKAVFVTLTYDDEHLPWKNSLYRYELQNYLKRLRKRLNCKIKYFACGEYGELNKRPHYHLIIYGLGFDDVDVIKQAWGRGFVKCGSVTADSIQYVCGYIMKKYNGVKQLEEYGERWPQFMACSKGIGDRWIKDNEEMVIDNMTVRHKGKPIGIPRYYKVKLGDKLDNEKLEAERKVRSDKRLDQMIDIVGDRLSITTALIDGRKMDEEALKTKATFQRKKL